MCRDRSAGGDEGDESTEMVGRDHTGPYRPVKGLNLSIGTLELPVHGCLPLGEGFSEKELSF